MKELGLDGSTETEDKLTYAKQQLGVKSSECGLLGLKWNKLTDQMCLNFPAEVAQPAKRGILRKLAKIYDPLGVIAPITLQGKLLYHDACEEKKA